MSKHLVRKTALKWLQRTWPTWFISMLRKRSPQEESITWLLSLGRTRRSKCSSVLWRNAFSVRDWDVIGHYRKVFGYDNGENLNIIKITLITLGRLREIPLRVLFLLELWWQRKEKKAIEDPYKKIRLLSNLKELGCNWPVIIKIVSIWQVTKKITVKKIPFRIHYHSTPKKLSLKNRLEWMLSTKHSRQIFFRVKMF